MRHLEEFLLTVYYEFYQSYLLTAKACEGLYWMQCLKIFPTRLDYSGTFCLNTCRRLEIATALTEAVGVAG